MLQNNGIRVSRCRWWFHIIIFYSLIFLNMTPKERLEAIRKFVIEIYEFDVEHKWFIMDNIFFIKNLPTMKTTTPFNRYTEEDPRILSFINTYGKAIMSRLYLWEWSFVKSISYKHFFIEHLNMVDSEYDTIYNILWDDVLFTKIYVPIALKKYECQHHLYLKKIIK